MPLKPPATISFDEHPKRTFLLLSGVLVLLLYWRSFTSPFVYDDLEQVVNNPNLGSWSSFAQRYLLHPVGLTTSFLGIGESTYRPLFWLSLFMDRSIWGLRAGGFHATNVVLHLLNGNLAFALLRRLKMPVVLVAGISLLWLALPIDTEVVAWVSGRAYLLCTLFIMVCLLSGLNYIRRGGFAWLAACFVTAACAVLSHELGILSLPLLLLLALGTKVEWSGRLRTTVGVICLAVFGVEGVRVVIGVKTFSGLASVKWACLALWQYVVLSLFPWHMSVERSTTVSLNQPHRWLPVELVCLALAFGYAVVRRRSHPVLLGGLVWFAVCIAPFCLAVNYQGVAERFLYVASLGMVAAVVAACSMAESGQTRNVLMVCVGVWSVWNLYRTSVRVADWSDPVRLYRSSLQGTPASPLLHYNLAFALGDRGDMQEALKEYQRVIEINSQYPHAYASLGDAYLRINSYSSAQAAYQKALAQTPNDTAVLLNSGAAYQGAGAFRDAEAAYERVVEVDPSRSAGHVNLGVVYLGEGRADDAVHQFAMAIDLKTKDPVPYYDLGVLMQRAGRGDLALVLYKKVLELKPNDEDTLRNIRMMEQGH